MGEDFGLRPLTLDDAASLAPMFHAYAAEVDTIVEDDPEAMRHRLEGPSTDLARDSIGALVDQRLVGFTVFRQTEEARLWGLVAPGFRRRGIGTALVSWGVERARAAPALAEVFIGSNSRRVEAHAVYGRFGFVPARTFIEMVHLDPAAIVRLQAPPGVVMHCTGTLEEAVATAVGVYNRAFVDHWNFREMSEASMAHEIGEPGAGAELSFFAYLDGRPVAMCLCRLADTNGFINELGVDPLARRRGIAASLLNHAMAELARLGARRVELDVDAANPTGAIRLYESAGLKTTSAFIIFELKLGPA